MLSRKIVWVGGLMLSLGSFALAQGTPLDQFTAEVGAVVRLREPDRTIEKVAALADAIQPGSGQMVQGNARGLGMLISNPGMTGVDQTKDWYIGVYAKGNAPPQVVFAVPAIDAEQMQSALENHKKVVKGNYVFYAEGSEDFPLASSPTNSISSKLQGKAAEVFNKGEVSAFLNLEQLTTVYRTQIDQGYDQIIQNLNNLQFQVPQQAGVNLGPVIEMYGKMAEGMFQGLNDARSLTLTVVVSESGASIEDYFAFHPDSSSGKAWGTDSTSALGMMEKLPGGGFCYFAGSGAGMGSMMRWSANLSGSMIQDADQKAKIEEAFKELESLKFGEMGGVFSIGTAEGGMLKVAQIAEISPVEKMRDMGRKMVAAMANFEANGFKQTTEIKTDAETYGAYKADVLTIHQEFAGNQPGADMQKKVQQIMFGPDGLVTRNLYMKDRYISCMGGGSDAVKQILAGLEASGSNGLKEFRGDLLTPASAHFLIDLPGGIGQGLKAASGIPGNPFPVDGSMIDNLNLEPSYIGFSLAAISNGIHCKTDIPVQQLQGFVKLSGMFAALRGGGGF